MREDKGYVLVNTLLISMLLFAILTGAMKLLPIRLNSSVIYEDFLMAQLGLESMQAVILADMIQDQAQSIYSLEFDRATVHAAIEDLSEQCTIYRITVTGQENSFVYSNTFTVKLNEGEKRIESEVQMLRYLNTKSNT